MLGRVFLLAFLAAVALAHDGAFTILSAPSYVKFDKGSGSLKGDEVPSVLANVLGFETAETRVSWTGLINENIFKRPAAVLTVIFDGVDDVTLANPVASFPLTEAHSPLVLSGRHDASLATLVSEMAGSSSFNLAVSAKPELAAAALPRDLSASRDLKVQPTGHGYADASSTVSISEEEIAAAFASGLLGSTVSFNTEAQTFTVGSTVFDLKTPASKALFVELHASLLSLKKALALPLARPSTFTVVVASARHLPASQQSAVASLLAAFATKASALVNAAFGGNVVSVAISTDDHSHEHHRVARSVVAASGNDLYTPKSGAPDFIADCQTYTCYCNQYTFPNGTTVNFNPVTACVDACPANMICPCAYSGCDCNSGNVQPGAARCKTCQPGFILQGGRCYVSSNFPGMFQIWLWGGVLIVVALISTCYAIGGMDPGRNGIIYRMTNQRAKTS